MSKAQACCAEGWKVARTSDVVAHGNGLPDAQVFNGLGREAVLFGCGVRKNGECIRSPAEALTMKWYLDEYMVMYPGRDGKMRAEWQGAQGQKKVMRDIFTHVERLNPRRAKAIEAYVRALPG